MTFQTISVIGLGYIGLPTASILATNGFHVLGVDIDPALARQLPYYPGYEWRQYGTDAVLVEVGTTVVREVLRDILR